MIVFLYVVYTCCFPPFSLSVSTRSTLTSGNLSGRLPQLFWLSWLSFVSFPPTFKEPSLSATDFQLWVKSDWYHDETNKLQEKNQIKEYSSFCCRNCFLLLSDDSIIRHVGQSRKWPSVLQLSSQLEIIPACQSILFEISVCPNHSVMSKNQVEKSKPNEKKKKRIEWKKQNMGGASVSPCCWSMTAIYIPPCPDMRTMGRPTGPVAGDHQSMDTYYYAVFFLECFSNVDSKKLNERKTIMSFGESCIVDKLLRRQVTFVSSLLLLPSL